MVSIEEFMNIDIRIGEILEVDEIEGAEKPLYALKVDLGKLGTKKIVAGIKNSYEKGELLGMKVVVVANLEPKRIAGMKSEGMILAGELDGDISLLMPDMELPIGTKIR